MLQNKIPLKNLILLDVFSYSCMNCLRSLEFIKKIDKAYKNKGLETIIVHPPEWNFEMSRSNIADFLKTHNIKFPVILDKDKKIIRKLKVDFWPAQILLKDGKVVYKHIGEGAYRNLERKIAKILGIEYLPIFRNEPKYTKFDILYLGKNKNGIIKSSKENLKFGIAYKEGVWMQKNEFLQSTEKGCSMKILTKGKIVSLVAGSLYGKPINVKIKLNGKSMRSIRIKKPKLYRLAKLKYKKINTLTIIPQPNLALYSFSFQ